MVIRTYIRVRSLSTMDRHAAQTVRPEGSDKWEILSLEARWQW